MSTVEVEVLRKEAREKEKREIEELRQKYKQRQNQKKQKQTTDPEKQALIQQAQQKEQQEKEQIRQKLKQRQKLKHKTPPNTTNPEKQALIQQAQQKEQQEKEQIRQKYKQRQKLKHKTPPNTTNPEKQVHKQHKPTENKPHIALKKLEKEDLYKKALNREIIENDDVWERFLIKKSKQNAERFNPLRNSYEEELESDGLESEGLKNEEFKSENFNISELDGETEELETVDRSALLAKYNINDIQDDDVTNLLENFDRSITDENVEEIEERLMETIKQSTLSHPKIEWVNVLVFLDKEEMDGNIKILAEYDDKNLLKRIISDNNKKLEVELIQIALYEVWDVFTTLGVNTNDLESKIEVEVELDRA